MAALFCCPENCGEALYFKKQHPSLNIHQQEQLVFAINKNCQKKHKNVV